MAGNTTRVTVEMKPTADIGTLIEGITDGNVKSSDKDTLQDIIAQVDEMLGGGNLSDAEEKALREIKEKAGKLIEKIEAATKAIDTDNIKNVKNITSENVTPKDKTDLEKAKTDFEKALEENSDNYTDDEKKAIKDKIKLIEKALESLGNVEAAKDQISSLPENVTKDDSDAVNAAKKVYDSLSDHEKSLIDPDLKEKLDEAFKALEEANMSTDTDGTVTGVGTSDQFSDAEPTGDNTSMLPIYVSLLSLIALVVIIIRKKKA